MDSPMPSMSTQGNKKSAPPFAAEQLALYVLASTPALPPQPTWLCMEQALTGTITIDRACSPSIHTLRIRYPRKQCRQRLCVSRRESSVSSLGMIRPE
jgi:hypothetical protein